jgi:hypothetical protein
VEGILYRSGPGLTDYMRERCRLDVYYPKHVGGFATVVWFHAGGAYQDRGVCRTN